VLRAKEIDEARELTPTEAPYGAFNGRPGKLKHASRSR
jgi:hypothetical protein